MSDAKLDQLEQRARIAKLRAEARQARAAVLETKHQTKGPAHWALLVGAIAGGVGTMGATATAIVQWRSSTTTYELAKAEARNAEADAKVAELRVAEADGQVKALQAEVARFRSVIDELGMQHAKLTSEIAQAGVLLNETTATLEEKQRVITALDRASSTAADAQAAASEAFELRGLNGIGGCFL